MIRKLIASIVEDLESTAKAQALAWENERARAMRADVERLSEKNRDLRARLEMAERTAKNMDEKLHGRDVELSELLAKLERRRPVDREAAIGAAKRVAATHGGCDRDEFLRRIVDAILGAAKAEPAQMREKCGGSYHEVTNFDGEKELHHNCSGPVWDASKVTPPAFTPAPTSEAPSEELVEECARAGEDAARKTQGRYPLNWEKLIAANHAAQAKRVRELEVDMAEVVSAAEEVGWNGVDNSKVLSTFVAELGRQVERLKAEAAWTCPADRMTNHDLGVAIYGRGGELAPLAYVEMGRGARALFGKGAK